MGKVGEHVVVILLAIVGVAVLAVVVSKNSNTANVIQATAAGFSQSLAAALSPITGNSGIGSFGGI